MKKWPFFLFAAVVVATAAIWMASALLAPEDVEMTGEVISFETQYTPSPDGTIYASCQIAAAVPGGDVDFSIGGECPSDLEIGTNYRLLKKGRGGWRILGPAE